MRRCAHSSGKPSEGWHGDTGVAEAVAAGLSGAVKGALAAVGGSLLAAFFGIPLAFAPGDLHPAAAHGGAAIPPAAFAAYRAASDHCPGLRWELLAAIGQVESAHGTTGGASIADDGSVSPPILGPPLDGSGAGGNTTQMPAGQWSGRWGVTGPWLQAVGPMQLLPGTFAAWAVDGDDDGTIDPHDVDDAVATAAALLCGASGRVTDERAALRRHNASDAYVEEVLGWAEQLAAVPPLVVDAASVIELLAHPNASIYADGVDDLRAGRVDHRVVAVLLSLARDHRIVVTSLVTGHSRCAVTGQRHDADCTVSNHHLGRGADIAAIDGIAVSARHPSIAMLMEQLAALPVPYRADEIGGPIDTGQAGVFTNSFHADHIHIGWDT